MIDKRPWRSSVSVVRALEEFIEEYSGEDGLLECATSDAGKVTRGSTAHPLRSTEPRTWSCCWSFRAGRSGTAVQELIEHDKELASGERQLAVEALVLHHGDREWNAPTRLRGLFRHSAPDTYRVVGHLPPDAPPPGPLDLPQMMLGLAGVVAGDDMREQLPMLRRVVEGCGDEDFDQFMARGVKAMLRSKGFDTDQLKEAMTMATVDTEFRRGWDAVRQEGIEVGRAQGIGVGQVRILSDLASRKFGQETAKGLSRLLARTTDGEQINRVAAAIVDCDVPDDFLARVRGG